MPRDYALIVEAAAKHRAGRDNEQAQLADIKRALAATAMDEGRSSLTVAHPDDKRKITVYQQRKGDGLSQQEIDEFAGHLSDDVALRVFPPVTRRAVDWDALNAWLAAEHQGDEADLKRRIIAAIDQETTWAMRMSTLRWHNCMECDRQVPETLDWRLCPEHQAWYDIPRMDAARDAGKLDAADLRRKDSRVKWLTPHGKMRWLEREHGLDRDTTEDSSDV